MASDPVRVLSQRTSSGTAQEGTSSSYASSSPALLPYADATNCTGYNKATEQNVFRVSEKDHLLPLDLAESVVLDDDNLDGELVLHGRHEVCLAKSIPRLCGYEIFVIYEPHPFCLTSHRYILRFDRRLW